MAKAGKHGWDRNFHGIIKRSIDENGIPFVFGDITINNGNIIARGNDQWELGDKLDELVLLVLDYDLHDTDCVTAINPRFSFEVNRIFMN